MTGDPQISITYQTPTEKEYTLRSLLDFLETQKLPVILAIDEFQQVAEYPEQNTEALLRTYIQQMKNVTFIFCGSKRSLMIDMFSNVKRPFYASTRYMYLDKIDEAKYSDFIRSMFGIHHISIDDEAIAYILSWTTCYTFYTQSLCHQLFARGEQPIDIAMVKQVCADILEQNTPIYLQYRDFLTQAQWNFLIAVAKEQQIAQITSQRFISSYHIGTPANARRLLNALIDKELILKLSDKQQVSYQIYDVFFARWLEKVY
jgi:hypothetical protein